MSWFWQIMKISNIFYLSKKKFSRVVPLWYLYIWRNPDFPFETIELVFESQLSPALYVPLKFFEKPQSVFEIARPPFATIEIELSFIEMRVHSAVVSTQTMGPFIRGKNVRAFFSIDFQFVTIKTKLQFIIQSRLFKSQHQGIRTLLIKISSKEPR